jgi:ABC-type polysaccharide/polyol phosphate export permease
VQSTEIRLFTPASRSGWRDVWVARNLLRDLVVRDLKVKYQRSIFGFLWTLLNPALTAAILIAVFSYVIRLEVEHFWAFLLSGYFAWNFVAQSLNTAAHVFADRGSLLRSVALPSQVLILNAVASKLVEFLLEMILVGAVLVFFHHRGVPIGFAFFPLLVVIQTILITGLMYPIAAVAVLFKDVKHALPLVITTLFYVTPVFYSMEMIPEPARPFFLANPFAGLMILYHVTLYEGKAPSATLLASVAAYAVAAFMVGYVVHKRYEAVCVEIA